MDIKFHITCNLMLVPMFYFLRKHNQNYSKNHYLHNCMEMGTIQSNYNDKKKEKTQST